MKTYLVGGAVRDKLLGKTPKDQDWVIVGATDEDVKSLIEQGYQQVGADFPVFLHPVTGDEYALARVERKVAAGYHGFEVLADSNVTIEEDLARRDLTINSMAMDDEGNIVDPFGGRKDLHNHVLRHTTAAFAEDPLRVMRLARFAARLGDWKIAPETIKICQDIAQSGEMNSLSIERIWVEMEKGFAEESPLRFIEVLADTVALAHCDALRKIFGCTLPPTQKPIAKALALVPKEHRLYVAIAVLGLVSGDPSGGSARARECHEVFHKFWSRADGSAASLNTVLKRAKALQEGPTFMDLVYCAMIHDRCKRHTPYTPRQLTTAQRIMREVKAADFPGLEGRDLGQAIESQRITNLQMCMDIPGNPANLQMG